MPQMNKSLVRVVRMVLAPLDEHVPERGDGRVEVAGHPFVLISAGTGLPRDVDRILPQLTPEAIAVASRFTSKARARLDAADANWADQTAARIRARDGRLAILVDGGELEPQTEAAKGFSPAALRVGERVLMRRRVESVAALAAAAGASTGRVVQVLRWFDEQGFTEKLGTTGTTARRVLIGLPALADAWIGVTEAEYRPTILAHTAAADPRRELANIERGLDATGIDYRLTGWAGVERVAPFLTETPTLHFYLDAGGFGAIPHALGRLGLVPVDEAGVVTFWQAPLVTFTADDEQHVVHPARLIADLRRLGGRGLDAAEHVREELFDAT